MVNQKGADYSKGIINAISCMMMEYAPKWRHYYRNKSVAFSRPAWYGDLAGGLKSGGTPPSQIHHGSKLGLFGNRRHWKRDFQAMRSARRKTRNK